MATFTLNFSYAIQEVSILDILGTNVSGDQTTLAPGETMSFGIICPRSNIQDQISRDQMSLGTNVTHPRTTCRLEMGALETTHLPCSELEKSE